MSEAICSSPPQDSKQAATPSPLGLAILREREIGGVSGGARRWTSSGFCRGYRGSKALVQRLELSCVHNWHDGCVNTVHFTESGQKLVSGSDDLNICIGDWEKQNAHEDSIGSCDHKRVFSYPSGHVNNVFQAKTMPQSGESTIVSCGADGQVRVGVLREGGGGVETRLLVRHKGRAHKIALIPSDQNVFLSTGEDGVIHQLDLRDGAQSQQVLRLKKTIPGRGRAAVVGLNCISLNPTNENEFCIGGDDRYVRVYDRRKIEEDEDVDDLRCLFKLYAKDVSESQHITCTAYSAYGNEILATYSEDDIYLFSNAGNPTPGEYLRKYTGHVNERTVKGVNFFGSRSEFIVSGSDCGHLFLWDKASGHVLNMLKGDDDVVNCLEPHPHLAVLATSGIDSSIKVWAPTATTLPDQDRLDRQIEKNIKTANEAFPSQRFNFPRWLFRNEQLRRFMFFVDSDHNDPDDDDDDDDDEIEMEVVSGGSDEDDDDEEDDDEHDGDDGDEELDDGSEDDAVVSDVRVQKDATEARLTACRAASSETGKVMNQKNTDSAEKPAVQTEGAKEKGGGEKGGEEWTTDMLVEELMEKAEEDEEAMREDTAADTDT